MSKKKLKRVEQIMFEQGQVPSLDRARALILAGEVLIGQERVNSGAQMVAPDTEITVRGSSQFVSRGGFKLDHALKTFGINPAGKICADVGAATGGFSDAMLQRGAVRVYAVDVGYGDLHWKVRSDTRVVPIERTNARYLETLPERVALIAVDVSFISAALLLENLGKWLVVGGDLVLLVKPQFEASQEEVGKGEGIVSDPQIHQRVLAEILQASRQEGFGVYGLIRSPIHGTHGNAEFLLWLKNGATGSVSDDNQLISPLFD